MNETRVEKFNALVRGAVTIGLTGAYVYMAVVGKIGADAFTGTLGGVLTWWFISRDRKAEQDTKNGNGNGAPPSVS